MQFIFTVSIPGMRLLGSLKYITHNNINNEAIECSQNNTCLYFLQALHAYCITQAQTYCEKYFNKNRVYSIFVYHRTNIYDIDSIYLGNI